MMVAEMYLNEDGTYPTYAWPGGYQLVYFTRDGLVICPKCANREVDDGQGVVGQDVYWEGPEMACDDCGEMIASAYGDPNGEDD